jgi:predicted transcriptional regulator YheO
MKRDPFLKCFEPVVDCIADLFGPNCEVVLHDISDLEHSIVKIRNGHVTGRKVGNPMTDVGLQMIRKAKNGFTILGNYNPRTKTGKLLKANAINIRTPKGKHIGILCMNFDVGELFQLDKLIQSVYKIEETQEMKPLEEHFNKDIWKIAEEIIRHSTKKRGHSGHSLTKEQKKEIIGELDKQGLFFIRGAVHRVSKSLGIAPPTVYKYLGEIRVPSEEIPEVT